MGRGRFGVGKIVPPKGWRWAPKTNWYAACVGRQISSEGKNFFEATQACKGSGGGGGARRARRARA